MERIKLADDGTSKKMIELVGMDQIAEYQSQSDLEDIELCDSYIISLGESLPLFSSAKRLNLSNNQIHQFSTVAAILDHFSSLQILLLNYNPLKPSPLPVFSSKLIVVICLFVCRRPSLCQPPHSTSTMSFLFSPVSLVSSTSFCRAMPLVPAP